jgi:hypothetical protein
MVVSDVEDVEEAAEPQGTVRQGPPAREEMPRIFAPVKPAGRDTGGVSFAITLKFNNKKFWSEMIENDASAASRASHSPMILW